MQVLSVYRNPNGWRVKLLGRRCHHGALGLLLIGCGAWLVGHDIDDFPWWSD